MARFPGKYANVKLSGVGVASAGEATTDVGGLHTTYQVSAAAHQVLDPTAAITVYKNGVAEPAANYTLDRLFGRVTFKAALLGTDVVTMDVKYLPMTSVAEAHGASLSHSKQTLDATTFASNGWTERESGLQDASGSIDRFYQADDLFFDALTAGSVLVVEFWRDQVNVSWRAWALMDKVDTKAGVADLIGQSIGWAGTTDADGRSVSYA